MESAEETKLEDRQLDEEAIQDFDHRPTLQEYKRAPVSAVALNEASQLFSDLNSKSELVPMGQRSPPSLRSPASNQVFENDEVTAVEK